MANENEELEGVQPEPVVNTDVDHGENPSPQMSEVEQRAREQGWVPQEEYTGTKKWRPAEEFLERGEFFEKIEDQSREIKNLKNQTKALTEHLETVRRTEYQRAINELTRQRREALKVGDGEAVVEAEDNIVALQQRELQARAQAEREAALQAANQPNPMLMDWVKRNTWYSQNKAMKIVADDYGHYLAQQGETNPERILAAVEKHVRQEFPHKFQNANRTRPGAVEGASVRGGPSETSFKLTADEREVMRQLVKGKHMTEAEYIADIKAQRAAERGA